MTDPTRANAASVRQDAATARPWQLCHHLQSAEKDASCGCGYRGSIWGGNGETLVCEMRNCGRHEGHEMTPVGSREEQLANAKLIVERVNGWEALEAENARLRKAGQIVLDGLNARIDSAPPSAVPVFDGIAELHAALSQSEPQ